MSDDEFENFSEHGQKLWNYLMSETRKRARFKSFEQVRNLKDGRILSIENPEELKNIFHEYQKLYQDNYSYQEPKKEKLIVDDSDSFERKLEDYVSFNGNYEGELSEKEFERLTKGWKKDRDKHSLDEWYQIYLKKLNSNPGNLIQYEPTHHPVKFFAFRSKNKINSLKKLNLDLDEAVSSDTPTYTFPIKKNQKFMLHAAAPSNTYLIDLMFEYQLCYLIAINVNTRYVYCTMLNQNVADKGGVSSKYLKTTNSIIRGLSKLLEQGWKPKLLKGDAEPGFLSQETIDFMAKFGCTIETVERQKKMVYDDFMAQNKNNKTEPLHSSLGIIDRVIRTLRDMAYTAKIPKITPDVMDDLVYQYNNAPHETLSKMSGMECSPIMAQNDPDLEAHITRRILQKNYNIMNKPGFHIPDFEYVKIYNGKDPMKKRRSIIQPGLWFINGFEYGKYHVVNAEDGEDQFLPRFRIHPE